MPCSERPASRTANGAGSTARTDPTVAAASVPMIVARRRGPDPRRPRSGVATAPDSRGAVSVHCALARDTCIVVATLVISGAPRLPTAATTSATKTSAGTSKRDVPSARPGVRR